LWGLIVSRFLKNARKIKWQLFEKKKHFFLWELKIQRFQIPDDSNKEEKGLSVFQKVICTNYNKNNQTAQLRDSHIILEKLMRSSIVSYFCTEDGQKVGRKVYRIN